MADPVTHSDIADIIAQMQAQNSNNPEIYSLLKDINNNIESLVRANPGNMSQGRGREYNSERYGRSSATGNDEFEERMDRHRPKRPGKGGSFNGVFDEFTDALEDQFLEGIRGSSFGSMISESLAGFADAVGIEIRDLPNGLGQLAGRSLANAFKNSPIGKDISDALSNVKQGLAERVNSALNQATSNVLNIRNGGSSPEDELVSQAREAAMNNASSALDRGSSAAENISEVANTAQGASQATEAVGQLAENAGQMAQSSQGLGQMLQGAGGAFKISSGTLIKSMSKLGVYGLIIAAALKALDIAMSAVKKSLGEAKESIDKTKEEYKKASDRYYQSSKQAIKTVNDRIEKDYQALIETPFKILKDSAESVQKAWDDTMTTITATQGYSKADLQDLMSLYAQRLQTTEYGDLTRVVSVADMTENLKKVLESGLSGQVAEEFAYLATILNRAIPTEDFFSYAGTYASIAANAIQAGQSQAQAIEYADEQLKQFASNVLYASREVAGGFSTGLKDASSLLESSVKIANTAKAGDAGTISGVLTSASAIIGAIAPDLGTSLIDNIVSAATGGNSEAIASLRSLADVGASNTEFLRALATDPQGVFANLFDRLASLQKMSNDNFMEVAEGLSSIFGVSMDAFARVDFNYLAENIREMNTSNDALAQNMALLQSGQTTATAEQVRMQQINSYILEEGLSYVLDNELAQIVQEHMWQQEQTKALQETTYGVNLVGSAMESLISIYGVVKTIVNILNPLSWGIAIKNAVDSVIDYAKLGEDVDAAIAASVVGTGNALELASLTNRNLATASDTGAGERVVASYLSAIGAGGSRYAAWRQVSGWSTAITSLLAGTASGNASLLGNLILDQVSDNVASNYTAMATRSPKSKYDWSLVGKSALSLSGYGGYGTKSVREYEAIGSATKSTQSAIDSSIKDRIQKFFDESTDYVEKASQTEQGASFEGWLESSGFGDTVEALSQYGITEDELQRVYDNALTTAGTKKIAEKEELELDYLKKGIDYFANAFPEFVQQEHEDLAETLYSMEHMHLSNIERQIDSYITLWTDYYINNVDYMNKTFNPNSVAEITNAEKGETGDAVLALANALTANEGLNLKDPVVQQNVLLAQILKVVEAIMQQNNEAATVSLPTTLSSLGLGITNTQY